MADYKPPKRRLHKEFLYLNHDTVLNSLSALEAGKVDEIIHKVTEAREGGLEAKIGAGPVKAGGGKKRTSNIEEELVKTRTQFSAFDSWHQYLLEADAIGTFDSWNVEVRDALAIGDTIQFTADLELSPLQRVLRTFIAFAGDAARPGNVFSQKGTELADTKRIAKMMTEWMGGRDKAPNLSIYLRPGGVREPRIVAGLENKYLIGSREAIEGTFTIIGQVSTVLSGEDVLSAIRVLRDVPPTQLEVTTMSDALTGLIEPAREMGVEIDGSDITIPAPAVIIRPIAVYQ